jgi:phage gp36-like protein
MNYASVQDMVDRFGELEMIQLTAGADAVAVGAEKAERALADAQAFADGFVGRVYRLPLAGCAKPAPTPENPAAVQAVVPPQLVRATCDVARYYLWDDVAPEHEVYLRFKAAERELQAIADGKAVLACPWGGQPGTLVAGDAPGEGEVFHGFSSRRITDESTAGYR